MKKGAIQILLGITILFAGFTLGFLFGRNAGNDSVIVYVPVTTPLSTVGTEVVHTSTTTAIETTHTAAQIETTSNSQAQLININTATKEELDTLPSIGPVIAQRIIDYRTEHGPFTSISQLLNVSGIGAERFAGLMDYVTTGG